MSGPDNLGVPTTHAGHQASAIFTAYIAEGSASGLHHNCQAESLPTCTLECEDSYLCSDTSMAKAATFPNSIADIPTQPLPAPLFSRERDCVLAYSSQRNVAKHDSSTKFSTPAQMHTMASCQSAPASLLPQREQQLCHQQQHTSVGVKQPRRVMHSLPRHHTAPPAFTSGSHRAPGSIRRSTAGMCSLHTAWSNPHGKGFASKLQGNAQCFVTSPSADAQVFDHQVPQMPQLWHSVQAQPATGDASQSDDSVAISAQHRQAWDASHGSLQSFKKLCRQLQSRHQQSWSIASVSDRSSKLPSIMHQQDASKACLSIPEYVLPDVRQLHKTLSLPEARQPFRCSSSVLPLPTKYPPVSAHQLWPLFSTQSQQPLPQASPDPLQPAQRSSLCIPQQSLPPSFQLASSAPCIPDQICPAATTCLPSQAPKAAAGPGFGQMQMPQCATTCSGSLLMSAAELEAVHASKLEELQHSFLDWMAANFAGPRAICRYI